MRAESAKPCRWRACAVAASAFGCAGGAAAVDVGDAGVTERDEVVDGLLESGGVVGADHVDGAVPHRAGDDDEGHAGRKFGQVGRRCVGAEQDQRLTAVLEQARDGAALVATRGDGAEGQFVVGGVGGSVEAADEVAVEGVLHGKHHANQPAVGAAQQPGAAVGAVAQLLGRTPHPLPGRRAGPGGVPHDDGDQRHGHAGAGGDVGQDGAAAGGRATRRRGHGRQPSQSV